MCICELVRRRRVGYILSHRSKTTRSMFIGVHPVIWMTDCTGQFWSMRGLVERENFICGPLKSGEVNTLMDMRCFYIVSHLTDVLKVQNYL